MEFENLLTLIKTVSDSDLTDFAYEENGTSIHLKKKKETVVVTGNSSNVPVMGLQTAQRWDRSRNQKQRWRKILQMVNQRVCL